MYAISLKTEDDTSNDVQTRLDRLEALLRNLDDQNESKKFHLATYSQVGIGTTTPNAQLEIQSSNQATPANTDGILIPKMDEFPLVNPSQKMF